MVSICERCGVHLEGAVAAVMHYDPEPPRPSPCDRRRALTTKPATTSGVVHGGGVR